MKLSKLTQAGIFLSMTGVASMAIADQSQPLDNVVLAGQEINQSAENSQQKINHIADQIQSKLEQFKAINKETDGLVVYNGQMQKQVEHQTAELDQLATSMKQVSIIERQISPLMARMIETLTAFIALDVPFLPSERSDRIAKLNAMMQSADIAVSEKFRRVMEAYQIEVNYGRTIEAYSDLLSLNGIEMDVDFLRIGRVAFIYQTRDGVRSGLWNTQTKTWDDLDVSYRTDINKALRIARKQLAPDLVVVPVNVTE